MRVSGKNAHASAVLSFIWSACNQVIVDYLQERERESERAWNGKRNDVISYILCSLSIEQDRKTVRSQLKLFLLFGFISAKKWVEIEKKESHNKTLEKIAWKKLECFERMRELAIISVYIRFLCVCVCVIHFHVKWNVVNWKQRTINQNLIETCICCNGHLLSFN